MTLWSHAQCPLENSVSLPPRLQRSRWCMRNAVVSSHRFPLLQCRHRCPGESAEHASERYRWSCNPSIARIELLVLCPDDYRKRHYAVVFLHSRLPYWHLPLVGEGPIGIYFSWFNKRPVWSRPFAKKLLILCVSLKKGCYLDDSSVTIHTCLVQWSAASKRSCVHISSILQKNLDGHTSDNSLFVVPAESWCEERIHTSATGTEPLMHAKCSGVKPWSSTASISAPLSKRICNTWFRKARQQGRCIHQGAMIELLVLCPDDYTKKPNAVAFLQNHLQPQYLPLVL